MPAHQCVFDSVKSNRRHVGRHWSGEFVSRLSLRDGRPLRGESRASHTKKSLSTRCRPFNADAQPFYFTHLLSDSVYRQLENAIRIACASYEAPFSRVGVKFDTPLLRQLSCTNGAFRRPPSSNRHFHQDSHTQPWRARDHVPAHFRLRLQPL